MRIHDRSRALQRRAESRIPGGVNSPVRAFNSVGGDPPFIVKGKDARVWDVDGNEYIDFVNSWGPLILGHAPVCIVEAIQRAATQGTSFGASTPSEVDLADLVIEAFPSVEKIRFVSSGTEATMSAIRLSRAFTKRKYVLKFEGCYHGHADDLLVQAGSGLATLRLPGSAGVLAESTAFTLTLPFNDTAAVEQAFGEYKNQIACIIVEPVVGNMGVVTPNPEYLKDLSQLAKRGGSLLILDEVITGFRLSFGGAQELFGIHPDLTCFGKIIGAGLPCGAFGGRTEIMDMLAPIGSVYQAGTLSGNPLAMAAGVAMISYLKQHRASLYGSLERLTNSLATRLDAAARASGVPMKTSHCGSMFTCFFTSGQVCNYGDAMSANQQRFAAFHRSMLESGIWLPPSQFEAGFLSTAHTMEDIDQTVDVGASALSRIPVEEVRDRQPKIKPGPVL